MNNKTDIDVKYVSPLKKICMTIGELPSSYLETMSYYEMLVWFTEFLKNTIIPTVNNNAEAVHELQSLYEELRTYVNEYFENLDVQDEINNKLDEMVEDGTLANILNNYTQLIKVYTTYEELIEDDSLYDGMTVKTLGYYNANDGGEALYLVSDNPNLDGYKVESGTTGLYLYLIVKDDIVNPKQFGAKGNGEDNDTLAIQTAIDTGHNVFFEKGTYLISQIKLLSNRRYFGNGEYQPIIKSISNNTLNNAALVIPKDENAYRIYLENLTIDGNKDNNLNTISGFYYTTTGRDTYLRVKNCRFNNCSGNGFETGTSVREMRIDDCQASNNNGHGFYFGQGTTDSSIYNCTSYSNLLNGYYFYSGANKVYNCKAFLNGMVSNVSNYEDRLAGFENHGNRNTFINNYAQENYGDGFKNYANECFITDFIGDNNGIYTINGEVAPLPEQINPYFCGIRCVGSARNIISGIFDNFRNTAGHGTQAYGLKLENCSDINASINAVTQKTERLDIGSSTNCTILVNGKINNTQTIASVTHSYTDHTNFPLQVERVNNVIFLTGRVKLDSNLTNTEINMGNVPSDYRPLKNTPISVFLGTNSGNGTSFGACGSGNISSGGNIFIRNASSQSDAIWIELIGSWRAKNIQ